jgi:hypothetical protein
VTWWRVTGALGMLALAALGALSPPWGLLLTAAAIYAAGRLLDRPGPP